MKKVRFLTSVSSVDGSYAGGELATIPEAVAVTWASAGLVELIFEPAAAEATAAPEVAATHARKRKA